MPGTRCSSAICCAGRQPASSPASSRQFTVVNLPSFRADPKRHGVRSETVIACNFAKRLVLIGGTSYAGETKKIGLHLSQLPDAREGRDADALLGQRRHGRRLGGVLRPLRHRQDDAVGRSQTHAAGRRRARLVGRRHLQFRGRLLRQDHPPLEGSRARDLGGLQPLRHGARERHPRTRHARARFRRRPADREHALRLSAATSSPTPARPARPAIPRTSSC